jgi:aspartokinase
MSHHQVSGYGETWSAQILALLLRQEGQRFHYVDARKVSQEARIDTHGRGGTIPTRTTGGIG